jgi:molecular chaperone GrpE
MTDPSGAKPGANRHPHSQEPHFEQDAAAGERPMYANEPELPAGRSDSGRFPGGSYAGTWDVSGRTSAAGAAQPPAEPNEREAGQPGVATAGAGREDAGQTERGQDSGDRPAEGHWREGQGGSEGGAGAAAGETDPNIAELNAALAAARAALKESQEQHLRAVAEMENVRRRAQEDVSKAHKFAIEAFAEAMLPVRDSLEMALTVEVPSVESLREGVTATLRQLTQAFERNRVVVIEPLHQKFDPHLHQAIAMTPSKEVPPNHVVSVLQKGYMINERILRPALVTVSQAS